MKSEFYGRPGGIRRSHDRCEVVLVVLIATYDLGHSVNGFSQHVSWHSASHQYVTQVSQQACAVTVQVTVTLRFKSAIPRSCQKPILDDNETILYAKLTSNTDPNLNRIPNLISNPIPNRDGGPTLTLQTSLN